MTRAQYNFAATEAAKYHDVDSYLSDVATSTIWGKGFGGEDVPIPAERIRELSEISAAVSAGNLFIATAHGSLYVSFML